MARKSTPQPLTLPDLANTSARGQHNFPDRPPSPWSPLSPLSPLSPKSPKSPRGLPFGFNKPKNTHTQSDLPSLQAAVPPPPQLPPQPQPARTALPSAQTDPSLHYYSRSEPGRQERPAKTGFFANYKATKSSNRLQSKDQSARESEETMSRDADSPALPRRASSKERTESPGDKSVARRPVRGPSQSNVSLEATIESPHASSSSSGSNHAAKRSKEKSKPKPFSLLSRTKSLRDEPSPREPSPGSKSPTPTVIEPGRDVLDNSAQVTPVPIDQDRLQRADMSSSTRQRSEDRQSTTRNRSQDKGRKDKGNKAPKETMRSQTMSNINSNNNSNSSSNKTQTSLSSSFQGGGHSFLNNLKMGATKGAGAISKGIFGNGKGGRSGSTNEREPVVDDLNYELKVINLPIVQQTRLTRISKKLEDSRDKTEFWMPAFPWRAIDYLNYKGSDVEGLYRVPGSTAEIKKWQRRFDTELDVDLFVQNDLYDINIIGSMLKAWLRELPDELFPKSAQDRIARECANAEEVPQLLIDELSNLSPFNYYLLFAITCHLSLLLAHSDKNKMDFRNLCICFQPCMKIDAFCFRFLVCSWRDCWKGCKTESYYVEQEYQLFDMMDNPPVEGRNSTAVESHDERNISSSDSSKPSSVSVDNPNRKDNSSKKIEKDGKKVDKAAKKSIVAVGVEEPQQKLPLSETTNSVSTVSTTLSLNSSQVTPPRKSADMRPLSPIKPLSPIGF